jgi:hypothetical protein
MANTCAIVDITIKNTVTWNDAFQFGVPGDTTWSFTGQSFHLEVKASADDATALFSATSSGGSIIVDDVVQRVLHMNVPESAILAVLPVATYVYDLVMFDGSTPPIRVGLMQGELEVQQGITES